MGADQARFWDRLARRYAANPVADQAGYERSLQETLKNLRPGDAVYEFGCGTGSTALRLAPHLGRVEASDISPAMIAIAREKAAAAGVSNVTFEVGTAEAAGPDEGAFDAAVAFNVLHLMDADTRRAALEGVRRRLKPDGLFFTKTPCLTEMGALIRWVLPLMQAVGKAPYVAIFSAQALEQDLTAAGFEIIERARHAAKGRDVRPFIVARRV